LQVHLQEGTVYGSLSDVPQQSQDFLRYEPLPVVSEQVHC
jgi:hypothetical protein